MRTGGWLRPPRKAGGTGGAPSAPPGPRRGRPAPHHAPRFRARQRRPEAVRKIDARLQLLSDWLGDEDYLEARFTVADLLMTAVLRNLRATDLVARHANPPPYVAPAEPRPAFAPPPHAPPPAPPHKQSA